MTNGTKEAVEEANRIVELKETIEKQKNELDHMRHRTNTLLTKYVVAKQIRKKKSSLTCDMAFSLFNNRHKISIFEF